MRNATFVAHVPIAIAIIYLFLCQIAMLTVPMSNNSGKRAVSRVC